LSSNGVRLRVILDTTFLLPTLGIDVGKMTTKALKRLGELDAQIFYSQFSILESLWIAARSIKSPKFDLGRFEQGMRSITAGDRYERIYENSDVFNRALELYKSGHVDMIDNILYANSAAFGTRFLTVDTNLRDFISENELEMTLISPDVLVANT